MMGCQRRQIVMLFVDMELLIPKIHPLQKIGRMVSPNFIYAFLVSYYPATGRPAVVSASVFKTHLIVDRVSVWYQQGAPFQRAFREFVKQCVNRGLSAGETKGLPSALHRQQTLSAA